MANTQYTPTPNPVVPGAAQAPFAGWNWNPQGSHYAVAYSQNESPLIKRDIFNTIVESIPQQFKLMNLLFNQGVEYRPNDETSWFEETWNRIPIIVGIAGAGGGATQEVPTTNTAGIGENAEVVYPDGTHGIVSMVVANTSFTVTAQTGDVLPAVVSGDKLIVQSYVIADGMNYFVGYDRLSLVEYTNFIQYFRRTKRWTRMEQTKHRNLGTTDYMERDKALLMKSIYQDAFATYLNGHKGQYTFTPTGGSGTYYAKSTDGIFPSMVSMGSQNVVSDPTTVAKDFEFLSFNTNYKNVDEPRYVICTDKMWYQLSTIMKDPIRYSPADKSMDLNLDVWHMGTQKFIPIIVELFKEQSYMFEKAWQNRILVVDMAKIKPLCMTGYEPFEFSETTSQNIKGGGREDYSEWSASGMIGTKVETADGHFWIDTIGM